jgi:hypothetical protein
MKFSRFQLSLAEERLLQTCMEVGKIRSRLIDMHRIGWEQGLGPFTPPSHKAMSNAPNESDDDPDDMSKPYKNITFVRLD